MSTRKKEKQQKTVKQDNPQTETQPQGQPQAAKKQKAPKPPLTRQDKFRIAFQVGGIVLFLGVCALAVVLLLPLFSKMVADKDSLRQAVSENLVVAIGYFLLFQLVQVVAAFVPGEAAEVAAGAAFGWFWGFVLCLIGVVLASTLIFWFSRKVGRSFVRNLHGGKDFGFITKLNKSKNRDLYIFLLFFIPALPKDFFTYGCAFLDMPFGRFLWVTGTARIYSILSSTVVGALALQLNWKLVAIIYGINGVLALACFLFRNKIMERFNKAAEKEEGAN